MDGVSSRPASVTDHRRPVKANPLRGGWLQHFRQGRLRPRQSQIWKFLVHAFFLPRGLDMGTTIR